jgi:hypothetical protein
MRSTVGDGMDAAKVSLSKGTVPDSDAGTLVEVKFNGGDAGFALTTDLVCSDSCVFDVDGTEDLIIKFIPAAGTGDLPQRNDAACQEWYKQTDVVYEETWVGSGTVDKQADRMLGDWWIVPVFVPSPYFEILAINNETGLSVLSFSAVINGTSYNTTNGTITTPFLTNSSALLNLVVHSDEGGGYFSREYNNLPVSSSLTADLLNLVRLTSYDLTNYRTNTSTNYVRSLRVSASARCLSGTSTTLNYLVDGMVHYSTVLACTNATETLEYWYNHSVEGSFNFGVLLNTSYIPAHNNNLTANTSFFADLFNPVAAGDFVIPNGFLRAEGNATYSCTDNTINPLMVNVSLNGITVFYGNVSNATTNTVLHLNYTSGLNTLVVECSDFFGSTINASPKNVYFTSIFLIDEVLNTPFEILNVSQLRLYYDDNSTYHDFKTANSSAVNFTSPYTNKLRLEITYADNAIVTRWLDTELVGGGDMRVCANREGRTHYDQLIISPSAQGAILKNVFSNCYVALDYTRFAYQDSYLLVAYTIASNYYLYTWSGSEQIFLASLDGSVKTYIDLSRLEFAKRTYKSDIPGDSVVFARSKTQNSTVLISYFNIDADNTELNMRIYNHDTGALVLELSDFTNLNNVTINFDMTTLNITKSTLFRLDLTRTNPKGETMRSFYFNPNASSGTVPPQFVFIIAVLLMIFGLTFTTANTTLSWFGAALLTGNLIILSLANVAWYVTFLFAINLVLLLFVIIMLSVKNYPTVA